MPVELYPPRPWNFLPFLEGPRGSAPHSNGQSGERKASGRASISKWALECCALRERTTDPQACKRQATFLYQQPPTQMSQCSVSLPCPQFEVCRSSFRADSSVSKECDIGFDLVNPFDVRPWKCRTRACHSPSRRLIVLHADVKGVD